MLIAIDFDGTLCEHKFPEIGKPNKTLIKRLMIARDAGHKLILWTCREGHHLQQAINWCKGYGLEFDAHNANLPETTIYEQEGRKVFADIYIDDRNISIKEFMNNFPLTEEEHKIKMREMIDRNLQKYKGVMEKLSHKEE